MYRFHPYLTPSTSRKQVLLLCRVTYMIKVISLTGSSSVVFDIFIEFWTTGDNEYSIGGCFLRYGCAIFTSFVSLNII